MNLYIEKEFLDNFYIDFEDRKYQLVLKKLISQYGERRVYINYKIDDFKKLKGENYFFALMGNICPPDPVSDLKELLLNKSSFDQDLIFMQNEESWFEDLRLKGVLCFSFDNYEKQLGEIIEKLHFRIDLSSGFEGWDFLEKLNCISFNEILITDGYILSDKDNQKIENNLIPLLSSLINENIESTQIKIMTKDLNPLSKTDEHIKEKAMKRLRLLNRTFANFNIKFKIIIDDKKINPYDFHDRIIQTNYSLTECGKGFNLSRSKKSNSQISSESIFEKYTYDRLKSHRKMQADYIKKLNSMESLKFKMYP